MSELTEERVREIMREELYRHRAIETLIDRGLSAGETRDIREAIGVLDKLKEWFPWADGKFDLSYFDDEPGPS